MNTRDLGITHGVMQHNVIFSLDNHSAYRTIQRNIKLETGRNDGIKVLIGKYKGKSEVAYITNISIYRLFVQADALTDRQESILHVFGEDQQCKLEYLIPRPTRRWEDLGYLVAISEKEADVLDNYTYDPVQDIYYTTRKQN